MSITLRLRNALFLTDLTELVVEGHRFDILEEIGCIPNTFNVTLAFPLEYIWPLVLSIVAAIYSGTLTS